MEANREEIANFGFSFSQIGKHRSGSLKKSARHFGCFSARSGEKRRSPKQNEGNQGSWSLKYPSVPQLDDTWRVYHFLVCVEISCPKSQSSFLPVGGFCIVVCLVVEKHSSQTFIPHFPRFILLWLGSKPPPPHLCMFVCGYVCVSVCLYAFLYVCTYTAAQTVEFEITLIVSGLERWPMKFLML